MEEVHENRGDFTAETSAVRRWEAEQEPRSGVEPERAAVSQRALSRCRNCWTERRMPLRMQRGKSPVRLNGPWRKRMTWGKVFLHYSRKKPECNLGWKIPCSLSVPGRRGAFVWIAGNWQGDRSGPAAGKEAVWADQGKRRWYSKKHCGTLLCIAFYETGKYLCGCFRGRCEIQTAEWATVLESIKKYILDMEEKDLEILQY